MTYTYSDNRINPLTGAISSRNIEETGTIALLDALPGVYGIQLRDGIVQGSLTVAENTTGGAEFTQVTEAPLAGQVAVTYSGGVSARGLLIFNAADVGTSVVINYDGYGSVTSKSNIENLASGVSTKGDLLTYSTSATQLAVGSNNAILQADSTTATGLKWSDDITVTGIAVKDSSANTVFTVDSETGQISNAYDVTTGTGYPATLHEGWLCRAWVKFDGTGTIAIGAGANVSSLTDNGTGDYTINFATNLPDTDYSCYSLSSSIGDVTSQKIVSQAVGSVRVQFTAANSGGSVVLGDPSTVSVGVFR